MDASAVLTLVQTFLQVLDSPISREIESVWGYKSQLQKLRDTMSSIKALFLDADNLEKRQLLTHTLKDKLERLQEAVYRAEDLFDEVATVAQRKKLMSGNKVCREVRLFFTRFNQLCSAFKMSREIREIRQMLDDIKNDHDVIGPIPLSNIEVSYNPRETQSFVCEEDVIIGRHEDKQKVIAMLVDEAATVEETVFVVSIVGIGGMGKTTLAQLVYNDDRIQREFQLKMWVCVSEDFDVKLLLRQILAEATKKTTDSGLTKEQLQRNLRQNLEGKRYLLVLDDIWNEDPSKWLELRRLLIQGGRGSTIIVTTRSMRVARTVGSQHTHQLEGLSDQDSWNLFQKMTLEPGQDQLDAHFVEIGKVIVSKCINVPLAIRVMGSLLRGHGESVWQNMMHTDLANVEQDENYGIMPVLKVSYDYLPSHLKSCFTFCAVFPKDYVIKKEDLIYLWMAHGFIMPLGGQSFEDSGKYYFENLLQRCFFQNVKRDDKTEDIVSCKMHDLIHDLAKGVAGKGIISSSNDINSSYGTKTRHIFIGGTSVRTKDVERYMTKMKRVRTCLGWKPKCIWFYGLVPNMRYLRALGLRRNYNMKKLSSRIGQLVHLRYLDLSGCYKLSMLPNSITQLFNLQTLKLLGCDRLKELPRELSKIVNLRHLDTRGCDGLRHMPPGMNRMTNLHKLTMFVVGGGTYNNNGSCLSSGAVGKLGDVKHLNNLTGELIIRFKEGWTYDAAEVEEGGFLIKKSLLDHIQIFFDVDDIENAEALLQALQPHRNVKVLRLSNYSGVKFPSWGSRDSLKMNLSSHLPNLVKLHLEGCTRLKHIPLLSQLSHLKVLTLVRLRELEHVESRSSRRGDRDGATTVSGGTRQGSAHAESIFFPSLEKLVLEDLPELKGWWKASSHDSDSDLEEGEIDMMGNNCNEQLQQENEEEEESSIVAFPTLFDLEIWECPNLVIIPSIPKVERLRVHSSNKVLRYIDSLPGESFQHLNDLVIENDDEIETLSTMEMFRSGRLSSLRALKFDKCRKVKSIRGGRGVWEHFTALESLRLWDMEELEMEDNEGDDDDDMPWRCLAPSLRNLYIDSLPKMGKLPMGMRHLTALQELCIYGCQNLEEIPAWISCLTSLQQLHIKRCPKVKSLPEEIRHLTSLNQLDLYGCSAELKERCQGADRHIIQHIPCVDV